MDALGGEMGKNIDATFIQSKMLNKSKGPAVHSLRAQADKKEYSKRMRRVLEETENISIKQAEVTELLVENNILVGVKTYTGAIVKYVHYVPEPILRQNVLQERFLPIQDQMVCLPQIIFLIL